MINKGGKGSRLEAKCASELKAEGGRIWKTIRVRYQNIDIFGLFDVLFLPKDGSKLRMIQVKSNRCDRATRETIRTLKVPKNIIKELWIWKDRIGWTKEVIE